MRINLTKASALLLSGKVVAIPTETVYGLAACFNNELAIKEVYKLKNRPPKNPLIMHVDRPEVIREFTKELPATFEILAKAFWPGPLTLVLQALEDKIPEIVRAGLPTQAFRIPDHSLTLELLKQTGPLVAPSANLSGRPSASSETHVESDFGSNFPVLAGGACTKGVESTILIYQEGEWIIGRLGAIAANSFEPILGYIPKEIGVNALLACPGQRYRHYAPEAALKLVKEFPASGWIIGFSDRQYPKKADLILWGHSDNPEKVLSHLYDTLRGLDLRNIKEAFIDANFPDTGLWKTLKERLNKASTK